MSYVRTIPYHEAHGELKATYDQMLQERGLVTNVQAVSGIRPHLVKTLYSHIKSVMGSESGLTPAEREMIATVVSVVNKCQY
jgi:alkylhydroperoxidase family enzyme